MKQGQATHNTSGGTKVEPRPHAINPAAVGNMGIMQGSGAQREPMILGQGLKAPMVGATTHKNGSQGKY